MSNSYEAQGCICKDSRLLPTFFLHQHSAILIEHAFYPEYCCSALVLDSQLVHRLAVVCTHDLPVSMMMLRIDIRVGEEEVQPTRHSGSQTRSCCRLTALPTNGPVTHEHLKSLSDSACELCKASCRKQEHL